MGGGGAGAKDRFTRRDEDEEAAGHAPEPEPKDKEKDKDKPDFGLSGALAGDKSAGVVYKGIMLKWSEPPEARMPVDKWRLYCFKDGAEVDKPLHLHRSSAFLFGRERKIADIPTDHPSCSSQHAVLQYRMVNLPSEPGSIGPPRRAVKPYLMDLESRNGTFLNGTRIEGSRYYELRSRDVVKFGLSTREYVLIREDDSEG